MMTGRNALIFLFLRRRSTRLKHPLRIVDRLISLAYSYSYSYCRGRSGTHLCHLKLCPPDGLAVCDRDEAEKRRMADNGCVGVAMLIRDPFAACETGGCDFSGP